MIIKDEIYALLGRKKLSKTPCRVEILTALYQSEHALTESEIRNALDGAFDRTTIYRTMRSFLEQDVIHSIALDGGELKYALNRQREKYKDQFHSHFHCESCNNVFCLSKPEFVPPYLPDGFRASGYDLLINGRCASCE